MFYVGLLNNGKSDLLDATQRIPTVYFCLDMCLKMLTRARRNYIMIAHPKINSLFFFKFTVHKLDQSSLSSTIPIFVIIAINQLLAAIKKDNPVMILVAYNAENQRNSKS